MSDDQALPAHGPPAWSLTTAFAFVLLWLLLQLLIADALILVASLITSQAHDLSFEQAVARVQNTSGDGAALAPLAVLSLGYVLLSWMATFALIRRLLARFPRPDIRTALGLVPPQPRWALVAAVPIGMILLLAGLLLLHVLRASEEPTPFDRLLETPVGVIAVTVMALAIAPFAEEIFFRGFVFPPMARRFSVGTAMAVNAALFAAVHLPTYAEPAFLPPLFLMGFAAAGLRARTGSVWPSIAMHFSYNACSLLLYFISPEST